MKHVTTRELYRYWDGLRASRTAPERSDLDPGAIRSLLGDVFLLELGGVGRHIVRLAGTRICTLLGRELTGHSFADWFAADEWNDLYSLLEGVAETALPAVAGVVGETPDGRRLDLELLVLPLRHRGRTHTRLLGSLTATVWPYWAGVAPLVCFRLVSIRYLRTERLPSCEDIDLLGPSIRAHSGPLRLIPGGRA
jgi:hypothetical protein